MAVSLETVENPHLCSKAGTALKRGFKARSALREIQILPQSEWIAGLECTHLASKELHVSSLQTDYHGPEVSGSFESAIGEQLWMAAESMMGFRETR
ncbi:proline iminopeptidase [Moniliophthora roreri]|nr:proline iminopeptidase [Moniliophthora roreri]